MKRTFGIGAIVLATTTILPLFVATSQQTAAPVNSQNPETERVAQQTFGCLSEQMRKGEKPTHLVGSSIVSDEARQRIARTSGELLVPKGETKLAKSIRKRARQYLDTQLSIIEQGFKSWLKSHPQATEEEIKNRRAQNQILIDMLKRATEREKLRINLPKWDWREFLPIGPVRQQGESCNTCWAFAASDAVAASYIKGQQDRSNLVFNSSTPEGDFHAKLGPQMFYPADHRPSVQELVNCMPIKEEDVCRLGWHGRAFEFFVYNMGAPYVNIEGGEMISLYAPKGADGGEIKYQPQKYEIGKKLACNPNAGFKQAASWDYVIASPDKIPSVLELKTALIEHGPLVAGIFMDGCFKAYRGGVFNENNKREINHVVLLIGWDDSKQAWLIKNSWGEEWGEKGFGWVKYGSNNIGQFAAWIDASP